MNNQNGGRFMDGFILGLVVGGGAVFLFGTEKGKKILKALNEEGVFDINEEEIKKILPKAMKKVEEVKEKAEEKIENIIEDNVSNGESNGHAAEKSPVRRFFKRK